MVKEIRMESLLAVVVVSILCLTAAFAQPAPTPPAPTAGNAPQIVSTFGGMKPGDTIIEGWTVREITFAGNEILITAQAAGKPLLTFGLSPEPGTRGTFDADGVRIYYENTPLPMETVRNVGKVIAERIVKFASGRGGLKSYVTEVLTNEKKNYPDQNVSREAARKFLDQLTGKWTVTVLQWKPDSPTPKTVGTGTAERHKLLNDLILREDAEGDRNSQFMAVGCSPEAGRCWLFVINNTSSGFAGGWGVFSRSENALRIVKADSRDPVVILRVVDQNRNALEFYEPGTPPRLTKTMRYDRAK